MFQAWLEYLPDMWKGIIVTVELTAASLVVALILGFILALARLSRYRLINLLASWYTHIVRAVPVLIILFIVYYGLGNVIQLSGPVAAVASLGGFYATLYGEIFRGGILGVHRGQLEAASALGMPPRTTMRKIILPQAFFSILPPATNQLSNLIKDTSLVFTISVSDLMFKAYEASSESLLPLDMLLLAGIIYFLFYIVLSKLLARWELNVQRSRS